MSGDLTGESLRELHVLRAWRGSKETGQKGWDYWRCVAVRTRSATALDLLCGGQAITVVTFGASSTGTAARSPCSWARHDSGETAQARPSATSCSNCAWSRTCGPGPGGEVPSGPGQRGRG